MLSKNFAAVSPHMSVGEGRVSRCIGAQVPYSRHLITESLISCPAVHIRPSHSLLLNLPLLVLLSAHSQQALLPHHVNRTSELRNCKLYAAKERRLRSDPLIVNQIFAYCHPLSTHSVQQLNLIHHSCQKGNTCCVFLLPDSRKYKLSRLTTDTRDTERQI
jgi:hypothetical protein